MDELLEFCARIVGDRDAAAAVASSVRAAGGEDRIADLAQAVRECRAVGDGAGERRGGNESAPTGELAAAVASEVAAASGRLPPRQRDALALRELLGLSHAQVAAALGIDPAAVASLLSRSRLRLRAELRGAQTERGSCPERERMLRTATLRQDGESVPGPDDDWLIDHLGLCEECARAHAALLEGSACYRGWRVADERRPVPAAEQADS